MSPKTPKNIFLWGAATPTLFHRTHDTPKGGVSCLSPDKIKSEMTKIQVLSICRDVIKCVDIIIYLQDLFSNKAFPNSSESLIL